MEGLEERKVAPIDKTAFYLKEYEILRGMIRNYIEYINNIQYYYLAGCAAVYAFCVQQKLDGIYSVLYFTPLLFTVFARTTYESFRDEIFEIRKYLSQSEKSIGGDAGGFDTFYDGKYRDCRHSMMRETRELFWKIAFVTNLAFPLAVVVPRHCS